MQLQRVAHTFFARPALELAPALLGTCLIHHTPEGVAGGRIVEVEAYMGPHDKAAHSYGNRRTRRTEVMYGPPGYAYVYQIYGMHFCLNVVCAEEGEPQAVLIRAIEPVHGIPLMARRRSRDDLSEHVGRGDVKQNQKRLCELSNGPGKLCQALGIDKAQNGWNFTTSNLGIWHDRDPVPADLVIRGPRVGIDYAEEARDYPWRFAIRKHPCVSRPRPLGWADSR